MKKEFVSVLYVFFITLLILFINTTTIAQQTKPSPPKNDDDVVRVNTNLVQSDVMVFDKNGRFVEGLTREQFELKVDGKPRDIAFFDLIKSGTANEDAKIAAARGTARANSSGEQQPVLLDRGRTVILFVDDLHLSIESMKRTKDLLLRFIDNQLGQNDQAAVISASGQLGFLQQITDNKDVLRLAVEKLRVRQSPYKDFDFPPMTEYQAIQIERNQTEAVEYFVREVLRQNPGIRRDAAENIVRGRARTILQQTTFTTTATLGYLANFLRSLIPIHGRKLILFFSDGFFIETNIGNATQEIRQVVTQAAKSHSVIYSIDARGLISGLPDSGSNAPVDTTGTIQRANAGELTSSQDGLYSLAKDTGGRAIFNTNVADPLVKKALEETSFYYLLAWASDDDTIRGEKFRKLEVNVIGRPDLFVQTKRGFVSNEKPLQVAEKKASEKDKEKKKDPAQKELVSALNSFAPLSNLPVSISSSFVDEEQTGTILSTSIELFGKDLAFENVNNISTSQVDVIAMIVSQESKLVASFQDKWTITTPPNYSPMTNEDKIVNTFQKALSPGLYQVRVAIRDVKNGRIGNASAWVEIPDLKKKKLSVGSLWVAERKSKVVVEKETDPSLIQIGINVSRRFSRSSYLRFLTYIYNATQLQAQDSSPDVALQVQVFRDDQPVITNELVKLKTQGFKDMTRLPYAAELSLSQLPVGRYVLQVTAIDRVSKTTALQKINFVIE